MSPLGNAPGAFGVGVFVALELAGGIVDVAEAISQIDDFGASLCFGGGGAGEFAFVTVIDVGGGVGETNGFDARNPCELRIAEEGVVGCGGAEVIAPGVAVALWIHDGGVVGVNHTIAVLVSDVVGLGVGDLAFILREVPKEAVVNRSGTDGGGTCVASAQKTKFL